MSTNQEDALSNSAEVNELCELFTKAGMVRECEKRGLPTAGGKRDLTRRVVEHDATIIPNDGVTKAPHDDADDMTTEAQPMVTIPAASLPACSFIQRAAER